MELKVKKLRPEAQLPRRATLSSTGLDLFACISVDNTVRLDSTPRLIGTGIAIEFPPGYDVQIRPRSGLSLKGVGVTLGTVDSDYRGEVMVTMYMLTPGVSFDIKNGDRIAQLVIHKLADAKVIETTELSATERGTGGHGSTGR
ncbi:MAG: dUTP diphosphatase [Dehalococcoidia bacterium]|jgi:dUTP pyrophosphatase